MPSEIASEADSWDFPVFLPSTHLIISLMRLKCILSYDFPCSNIIKFLSNCYHVGTWNFGWSDSVFLDHESLLFDSKINSLLSPTRWEMCFCVSNIIGWHETPDSEWREPPKPHWIAPPTEDHVSHIQMPKTIEGYLISITQEVTTKPNSTLSQTSEMTCQGVQQDVINILIKMVPEKPNQWNVPLISISGGLQKFIKPGWMIW